MQKIALLVWLLTPIAPVALAAQTPTGYTINVHVGASRCTPNYGAGAYYHELDVVRDGKKYELQALMSDCALLALGDYPAKLTQDKHKTAYESARTYELLFPDKKTRQYMVVGQTE
jgi:hypothetical protein